ncbi:MAG: hypothetical protein DMF89_27300 [Acidobacteria bacterium]|nr:MAG: hypothetical protein DMF89_27300 [Acidobacteriota bacterium]
MAKRGFDVVHLNNPPDVLILAALPFKLLGKKIIFDQHDLSPEIYPSTIQAGRAHRASCSSGVRGAQMMKETSRPRSTLC